MHGLTQMVAVRLKQRTGEPLYAALSFLEIEQEKINECCKCNQCGELTISIAPPPSGVQR